VSELDPYAGTVYRDLTVAEDAAGLARYFGAEGGIGHDRARAIEEIDNAIHALTAARMKLSEAFHG
jgi:hypothetical protein